jgi:dipeptidyl aminopeptidase/acylaminoacyl peptidase
VYPHWKTNSNQKISDDGQWVTYEINPMKGDGFLYIYSVEQQKLDSFARGKNAQISPLSDFIAFQIAAPYDSIRQLKLKKTPKDKLPKDSLAIYYFAKDSLVKIPNIQSFVMTQSNHAWIAYEMDSKKAKKDKETDEKADKKWLFYKKKTTEVATKEIKQEGKNILLWNPISGKSQPFDMVDEYKFNKNGTSFFALTNTKLDSGENSSLIRYDLLSQTTQSIFDKKGSSAKMSIHESGNYMAFLHAQDTSKSNKIYDLYLWRSDDSCAQLILDTSNIPHRKNWSPSINASPYFSKDASKLFFGIAPNPIEEPKDSLLDDEKYQVDVWNYQDLQLQPEQKLKAKKEAARTYLTAYEIINKNIVQLEDSLLKVVITVGKGSSHYALGMDQEKYGKEQSWDGFYADYYIVNIHNGQRELILEHHQSRAELSPNGNFLIYYNTKDKNWYSYDVEARKHLNITKHIPTKLYDELNDIPQEPSPYGIAAWFSDDKFLVISDRYDLWKIDPTDQLVPENLTKDYGRNNKIRFRNIILDEDHDYINEENPTLLIGFNEITKASGYYSIDIRNNELPITLITSDHRYYNPIKAKNTDRIIYRRSSFCEYPDLQLSNLTFSHSQKISNVNPQQANYFWGNVELIKWTALDGQKMEGLLYKPEFFDSTKQYPMIVYFYERYSDELHNHYIPSPSYSTINFTEYTSNGYIVFVPDISYQTGHPAKSAYNSIVSGTEFLKKNPWIDGKHIGLQGQSWGGYQTAMLITMTDIYACAEAGAPVSNMISAYGGIRWGSGVQRGFQYEKGQSRIGVSIWDNLNLYIENSPIFHAKNVKTPLLIMHNDADGAVPWYQGIEYFTALRRLDKKVWMLTYNGDDHNLTQWPNRVDLSIRMMQFFDHYLKEKPMPVWMSKGIPAYQKGKINGYELSNPDTKH